ncbi:helix-turn-helix domain-containing protein [Salinicoccus sp. HZC-1]
MLIEDPNIKEIAELVGYNTLNHFYKYFNKYVRVLPSVYKKGFNKRI